MFVTNVELSSASGGGRDRAFGLIRQHQGDLPLKGYDIWDGNQLEVYLDAYSDLRARFQAHLTPGDLIAALLQEYVGDTRNIDHVLTTHLESELRGEACARLDQAGNRTEEQIHLARLFTDLPASTKQEFSPPEEASDTPLPPGVLQELLTIGSLTLDPATVYEQEELFERTGKSQFPTRFMILGGPGSGKSTITQYLAQIYRSALLLRRPPQFLDSRSRQIIEEIHRRCGADRIPWPATPRYPFRVDLNQFAKALASNTCSTLSQYFLQKLHTERDVQSNDLLRWITRYPSALLLDGLDEVPPTSNRKQVVDAIDGLLSDLRHSNSDVFVIATSRQIGYTGEFANGAMGFKHIMPLSPRRAMECAGRYTSARLEPTNPSKAFEVIETLKKAANNELTSQLMTSPLQVTFMATVVAARGNPGEDRWQLFSSYYRTIYDRERQKAVPPFDEVLTSQQPTIDRLHHDVGFILQCRSETEGKGGATLQLTEFQRLTEEYLRELGREGQELLRLSGLIAKAANERLVFLTSRIENELAFEVRSLQEFMASECLMSGDSDTVRSRLRAIAASGYWRNVTTFCASKCFVDQSCRHLQDSIPVLCSALNTENEAGWHGVTKSGSVLALDILLSGAVAQAPRFARLLASTALELIEQPLSGPDLIAPEAIQLGLGRIYREDLELLFTERLTLVLGQNSVSRTLAAWPLVDQLIGQGSAWARRLAEANWPNSASEQREIIYSWPWAIMHSAWFREKIAKYSWTMGQDVPVFYETTAETDPFATLSMMLREGATSIRINDSTGNRLPIALARGLMSEPAQLEPKRLEALRGLGDPHPAWIPYLSVGHFLESPSPDRLATLLENCADGGWEFRNKMIGRGVLPWPVASCLTADSNPESLRKLASDLRHGRLGSAEQWSEYEKNIAQNGIAIDDLFPPRGGGASQTITSLTVRGEPPYSFDSNSNESGYRSLLAIATSISDPSLREYACGALVYSSLARNGGLELHELLGLKGHIPVDLVISAAWRYKTSSSENDLSRILDDLGLREDVQIGSPVYGRRKIEPKHELLWEVWESSDSSNRPLGLLRIIATAAAYYERCSMPDILRVTLPGDASDLSLLYIRYLELTRTNLTEAQASNLASEIAVFLHRLGDVDELARLLFLLVLKRIESTSSLATFLMTLRDIIPPNVTLGRAQCDGILRMYERDRPTNLHSPEQIDRLRLPHLYVT